MSDLLARLRLALRDHRRVLVLVVCWLAAAALLATVMSWMT
jgi:hypothetical protein